MAMSTRFVTLALVLLTPMYAVAQSVSTTTGAINGTVTDATKAILPGVTVTLSGPAVMGVQTTVTDQNGLYRFAALARPRHRLAFEPPAPKRDARRHSRQPRVHGDRERRDEPGLRLGNDYGERRVAGRRPAVHQRHDALRHRSAGDVAGIARFLGRDRADAGRLDVACRCRRQRRAHAAALHRIRFGERGRRQSRHGRGDHGERGRGRRRQRHVLHGLRILRGDRRECGRQHG